MSRYAGTGLNFVKRVYPPRVLGMLLAFPAIAIVLFQHYAPWHFWLLAAFTGFLWPHIAYLVASRSSLPTRAEYRNLYMDSVLAGLWVPMLSFNVLPALVLLTMTSLDNMSIGGWRLCFKGLLASLVGGVVGWAWAIQTWPDFTIIIEPTILTVIAVAPLLVVFPLSIGIINFGLSRRLAQQREEQKKMSPSDDISLLNNRHIWEVAVSKEFERHKRNGSALSLIILDIDSFKLINEKYGHVAGDQVIRDIADLLKATVRGADEVGRCGGEEFGLLLPDTDLKGALEFAERLRLSVQTLAVKPYGIRFTISLGVAAVEEDVKKYRQLIEHAEKALHDAKNSGRNIALHYEAD